MIYVIIYVSIIYGEISSFETVYVGIDESKVKKLVMVKNADVNRILVEEWNNGEKIKSYEIGE